MIGGCVNKQYPPFGAKICSRTLSVPRSLQITVSFEEQIVQGQISEQMEATVFIILQIFFAVREVLKIGEYFSDIQSPVLPREYS